MRNPHKPFNSWGILLIMLGVGLVLCLADSWNGETVDTPNSVMQTAVQR